MMCRRLFWLVLLMPGVVLAQTPAPEGDHLVLRSGKMLWGDIQLFKSVQTSQLYVVYQDSIRYDLGEIRTLSSKGASFYALTEVRKTGRGASLNPILLQRRIDGRVRIYSHLKAPPRSSDPLRYAYYSMGDAVPVRVKIQFLRRDMADYPPSVDALKRAALFKNMGHALFGVGMVTALVGLENSVTFGEGFLDSIDRKFVVSSTLLIGLGMVISALLPYNLSKARVREAVRLYNSY